MNNQGKFITLEGGEGVGKTTNVPFIKTFLEKQDISLIVTREPGGTRIAEKIREILIQPNEETLTVTAEILLVFAARAQHLEHVIKPALAKGQWVLCDRFTDATYAYQSGGRNMPRESVSWLETFVQGELQPDLTLLLDAPVNTGMARAKSRAGQMDRFESEHLHFFNKVQEVYLQRAEQYPERIKIINADQSLNKVQSALIDALSTLLP
jgi:dTMP kinase